MFYDRVVRSIMLADTRATFPGCSLPSSVIRSSLFFIFTSLSSNSRKVIPSLRASIGSLSSMHRHILWSLSRYAAAGDEILAVQFPAAPQAVRFVHVYANPLGLFPFLFWNMGGRPTDPFCNRNNFRFFRRLSAGTSILRLFC